MTEQMLRDALRDAAAASPAPPPMSSATMVRVARRARTRRRVGWSGASCAAVAIAVGTAVLPAHFTASPSPRDQGPVLLDQLLAVVPDGYTTTGSLQRAQPDGADVWEYQAQVALSRDGGTGQVVVEVHTPGNRITGEPCTITEQFRGLHGDCQVIRVGVVDVGVAAGPGGPDGRLDQWAGYRYPDGTVVYLGQAQQASDTGAPLPTLPFGVPQLAALATDQRFDLG